MTSCSSLWLRRNEKKEEYIKKKKVEKILEKRKREMQQAKKEEKSEKAMEEYERWLVCLVGFGVFFAFCQKQNIWCSSDCEHLSIVILVRCCAVMREARRWQHYIACRPEFVSKILLKYGALDIWHTWKIYSPYLHVIEFSISISLHFLSFHIRSNHLWRAN